jgi:serpin B
MNLKLLIILSLVAVTLIAPMGCAEPVSGEVLKSDKPRVVAAVNMADTAALVAGNSAFALDMYRKLGEKGGNLVFSPYSISQTLAMTYAGAAGSTEQDMARAMHFDLPQDRLHPAFNSLDQELAKRQGEGKGKDGKGFRLNIVNAIWGQQGYRFMQAFLDTLATDYGAGLRTLDYKRAPEPSRLTINDWVKQQTEGRIVDLIPPRAIDTMTRLVLTNAIYFNAAWQSKFQESSTSDGDFHNLDGSLSKARLMQRTGYYRYVSSAEYQAVELPYEGNQVSMVIIAPAQDKFNASAQALNAKRLALILEELKGGQVELIMPRFKTEFGAGLKDALSALGMSGAFSSDADFSRMTGDRDLYISDAIHKAFIEVDESGTEAAAATAVIMNATAMPARPVQVKIDRPFIYLIRDMQTGTVLFLGQVVKL